MSVFQGSLIDLALPTPSANGATPRAARPKFWTALRVRQAVNAVANLGGSALVALGVGMVSLPAGVIAAGVLLVLNGFAATLPPRR